MLTVYLNALSTDPICFEEQESPDISIVKYRANAIKIEFHRPYREEHFERQAYVEITHNDDLVLKQTLKGFPISDAQKIDLIGKILNQISETHHVYNRFLENIGASF